MQPTEFTLNLAPTGRFDVIDVTRRAPSEWVDLLRRHQHVLYASFHTTAGYLDRRLAARLLYHRDRMTHFLRAFGPVFPPGGAYRHDQMHLRAELSDAERRVEPRNGDSHLTFIGSGMRNVVTYHNQLRAPVYFIDLDGVKRVRQTRLLAYDREERVAERQVEVPVSRHPIDSVNLADPRLGLAETIEALLARTGVEKGRVDIALAHGEPNAGITVNEYETLLMRHDLAEVLRDPLRFAKLKGKHILDDPLALPGKSINYAKYDMVRVLNSLMEAFRVNESVVERLIAKVMAVPARRFLRSRRVSFLASDLDGTGRARLVRGKYQSPILVQWQAAARQSRRIDVTLYKLS
ncbi:MAG TPA: hypothetical protein VKA01_15770 [Vicinamibacteria bacterium]|nr:hypothetical protein [Vicinamibacteria bacterium]